MTRSPLSALIIACLAVTCPQLQASDLLASFLCREDISRYSGNPATNSSRLLDEVTAQVSFENGSEEYHNILQSGQSRQTFAEIGGAWSEGEFGTLIQQTNRLMQTQRPDVKRADVFNGIPATVYRIDSTPSSHLWSLKVGSRSYDLSFRSAVWVAHDTGEILGIERVASSIPARTGILEIRWAVELSWTKVGDGSWMLPASGRYVVTYSHHQRREWNEIRFADYRRYGSESKLSFRE